MAYKAMELTPWLEKVAVKLKSTRPQLEEAFLVAHETKSIETLKQKLSLTKNQAEGYLRNFRIKMGLIQPKAEESSHDLDGLRDLIPIVRNYQRLIEQKEALQSQLIEIDKQLAALGPVPRKLEELKEVVRKVKSEAEERR